MPGVTVTTSLKNGPSTPLRAASGQFFVAGLAERGPTDEAVLIRGLADYEAIFGARAAYGFLYDTVKTFFDEGGEQVYVVRTVGIDAAKGTITLKDRATPTAADTLIVNADSPGAWSGNLHVRVEAGSIADTVRVSVLLKDEIVESYTNLATPQEIISRFRTSKFVDVQSAGSASVAPLNLPALGDFQLSAGDDKRGAVVPATYVASLDLFTEGFGDGAVAIPGVGPSVHAGLIAHCRINNRVALLSHNEGASRGELDQAVAAANSDCAGMFEPWLQINDGNGGVRNAPPEGFVAACRARAHDAVGPWRAPAGGIGTARGIVGLAKDYSRKQSESLDAGRVNLILRVAGAIRLYGWRSTSADEQNYRFLSARDLLNRLVVESAKQLEQFVFSPIDSKGQLLSSINAQLVGIVEPIRVANGLYEQVDAQGNILDDGYLIETGPSVNSTQSLNNNEVRARMSVRLAPTGAMISLDIVKVNLLSGL